MTNYLINAFATLFVTIDPIGLTPMFLAVTTGWGQRERISIALRAVLISFLILLIFLAAGSNILKALGISLPAFQIAGGLLLLFISMEMIFDIRQQRKTKTASMERFKTSGKELAVFPLAIPLIAGPASISAVVLLSTEAPTQIAYFGLIGVVISILTICFLTFLLAGIIDKYLHASIQLVLTRLLGIILAALSVQFIADGITAYISGN